MMLLALSMTLMLEGRTPQGEACRLEIQSVEDGAMTVRSGWQRPAHGSVRVTPSPSPWAYYGIDRETRDQIAVIFRPADLTPENIQSYLFEGWDENGKRVQAYCRFL